MSFRIEVYNKFNDHLGDLPNDIIMIREYEKAPLSLKLYSDKSTEKFELKVGDKKLKKKRDIFYFKSEIGRRGDIKVLIYYDNKHIDTGCLRITGQHINEVQFNYLIKEIKYYLISIISADKSDIKSENNELGLQFINFYDRQLDKIEHFLKDIKRYLTVIEQCPQQKIIKHYHIERKDKAHKIDIRTIRWKATNGAKKSTHALTYTNIEDFDVYENQFIVYILKLIQQYINELSNNFFHAIEQKIEELKYHQQDWNNYNEIKGDGEEQRKDLKKIQIKKILQTIKKIEEIKQKKLPEYRSKCDKINKQINQLLQYTFLKTVQYRISLVIKPTLVLLRNPAYNNIYKAYQELEKELKFNKQQKIETLLMNVPIERTSKLYEYWVFIQVYEELKRMGFKDVNGSKGILGMLDKNTFRLKEGTSLELVGNSKLYKDKDKTIKVIIYYNLSLGKTNQLRPDILIKFIRNNEKILILDAKYRDYNVQGDNQYKEDVSDTAHKKYKLLQRKKKASWIEIKGVDKIRKQIAASFIIHSHPPDKKLFLDYGSEGHSNEYGAIPLVPDKKEFNSLYLKRLLRMFMRMHLHLFDICWSESHQQPVKAEKGKKLCVSSKGRKPWEYEYYCPECDNRWWVNHCGHWCKGDKINVTKITFSDPIDNFFDFDPEYINLLKCSQCNKSYY